jgi:hypothetical protein
MGSSLAVCNDTPFAVWIQITNSDVFLTWFSIAVAILGVIVGVIVTVATAGLGTPVLVAAVLGVVACVVPAGVSLGTGIAAAADTINLNFKNGGYGSYSPGACDVWDGTLSLIKGANLGTVITQGTQVQSGTARLDPVFTGATDGSKKTYGVSGNVAAQGGWNVQIAVMSSATGSDSFDNILLKKVDRVTFAQKDNITGEFKQFGVLYNIPLETLSHQHFESAKIASLQPVGHTKDGINVMLSGEDLVQMMQMIGGLNYQNKLRQTDII